MPSSAVRTFSDAEAYGAAIRAARVQVTVTERGQFEAKLLRIDFHRLWMQRFSENLPRVVHNAIIPGRAAISFQTRSGPCLLWSGVEMKASQIVQHSSGHDAYQLSRGAACFGSMSLTSEHMASVGATMAGIDLTPPHHMRLLTPSPSAMAKLLRLHAAAGHLAENNPELIANPDSAHGLEQALVEAMVRCLDNSEMHEDSVAQRQHELIMHRFFRLLEEDQAQPLYVPEICQAIGVSDRTLRVCCHEQFGMGPKHYLLLRRLHLAERALRRAAPGTTTVTDVATRYGFWHLGLFASEYRSLFGEPPSATLRRQPS
jgi:AraC-like DNA-binding protein